MMTGQLTYSTTVMDNLWKFAFFCLVLANLCGAQETNVALNQTTSQQENLDYSGFLWTSDKAVDGCTNGSQPNTDQCCSSSNAAPGNFWRLELDQEYDVHKIVIYGRTEDTGAQLSGFQLHVKNATGGLEMVYNNDGVDYGNGVFTVLLNSTLVKSVEVTRDSRALTLCEVEVYSDTTMGTTPNMGTQGNTAQTTTAATILYPMAMAVAAWWHYRLM